VAAGLGACILPRLGRGPIPAGVSVVPTEPALRRHVYAAWRTQTTRKSAIAAAVEELQLAGKKIADSTNLRNPRNHRNHRNP
jgi:DNA-binding transcriptional LysR family regulator